VDTYVWMNHFKEVFMIVLENVSKTYKMGKEIITGVTDINLNINKGDFVCIMGPSGAGKSTLLHIMGCIDQADSGNVLISGKDVSTMKDHELSHFRNVHIGFIFQFFNLVPVLNVYENIEYPLILGRRKVDTSKILELIELVGLMDYIKHKPDELSGGQRQRVAIARALITEPDIVLADEPTANLDSRTGEGIVKLLYELNTTNQTTFVFSTHNPLVAKYARTRIDILDGRIENIIGGDK